MTALPDYPTNIEKAPRPLAGEGAERSEAGEGGADIAMTGKQVRQLRADMTEAERRLWSALRDRRLQGFKFRRQHPLGSYILDFACVEHRLAIEADGGQHAGSDHDRWRTEWLEQQGWRIIRFWNNDILQNTAGVLEEIIRALERARDLQ